MAQKVLVAISGGVDSTVAVILLKQQGFEVETATIELEHNQDEQALSTAVRQAQISAAELGVKHHIFYYKDRFEKFVVSHFCRQYTLGRTPNPCVECNKYIKFGAFFDDALAMGFDLIATGHYAKIQNINQKLCVVKSADSKKDQTYMLYNLREDMLEHIVFPCGDLTKGEIRKIAEDNGLSNHAQKDSLDICFIPDGDYAAFLKARGVTASTGNFVDTDGNVMATHSGIINYTIGQRKGLGVGFGKPIYVVGINAENNEVLLGIDEMLFKREMDVENINWINRSTAEPFTICASVKTRYSALTQTAAVQYNPEQNTAHVCFDAPVRAITPGQSAVFYDGDILLGGGTII